MVVHFYQPFLEGRFITLKSGGESVSLLASVVADALRTGLLLAWQCVYQHQAVGTV